MTVSEIASEALRLPASERALLTESLWESLGNPLAVDAQPDDYDVAALALERDRQIESGLVQPVSHDEMIARLRR